MLPFNPSPNNNQESWHILVQNSKFAMQGNTRTSPSLWARFCQRLNMFGHELQDSISSRVNAAVSTVTSYIFCNIQMGFFNAHFNQAISFIIPTLAALLQLKYQGNTKTPFTTHPLTMTTAVFTAFGYYFACIVQLKYSSRRFMRYANRCMVCLGNVSVSSLASVFFPDSVGPLVYLMPVLVSAGELIDHEVYQRLFVEAFDGGLQRVRRLVRNLGRLSWFQRAPTLPR